jgi:transposase-like protein
VLSQDGPLRIDVPHDRQGRFEPPLIPKHERRFTGFDDKIVAMYARGMSVREIQAFLAAQYSTEVLPEFITEALAAVFRASTLQTCIVHLIRNSLDYASSKERKALAAAIKPIYTAPSAEAALAQLEAFAQGGHGARNSRPWQRPGVGPGTGSFPSLRSRLQSAG